MKTPIEQAIEKLKEEQLNSAKDISSYQPYQRAINILKSLLPTEQQVIEDAITTIAPQLCFMMPKDAQGLAKQYFTETFKNDKP